MESHMARSTARPLPRLGLIWLLAVAGRFSSKWELLSPENLSTRARATFVQSSLRTSAKHSLRNSLQSALLRQQRSVALRSADDPVTTAAIGKLPPSLVAGALSKPEHFQRRFLDGFVEYTDSACLAGSARECEPDELSRDELIASIQQYQDSGAQEVGVWNAYLEKELGRVIGDPYVFDLRMLILDPATRKAVRRAARAALMEGMLLGLCRE
eukprot:TRINITY_DN24552_c0_g1_i2.p1 TRINITY_DN24552_c0_g1~~TRINITY_DN24552_c0_g1_i2.p1  ORF type:complete len:231 (+),score=34.52 TRINITY_DN24552_c0_g1_i2:56-694(+)